MEQKVVEHHPIVGASSSKLLGTSDGTCIMQTLRIDDQNSDGSRSRLRQTSGKCRFQSVSHGRKEEALNQDRSSIR
jgi:hypothetical protein